MTAKFKYKLGQTVYLVSVVKGKPKLHKGEIYERQILYKQYCFKTYQTIIEYTITIKGLIVYLREHVLYPTRKSALEQIEKLNKKAKRK